MKAFDPNDKKLRHQFDHILWLEESGIGEDELNLLYKELMQKDGSESRAVLKAKLFALHCERSRYALDINDIFQDKLFECNLMELQRSTWCCAVKDGPLARETKQIIDGYECGAYYAGEDFGHTSPNSKLLLEVGFSGLLERVEQAAKRESLSPKQAQFYESCKIVLHACITFILRLADGIAPYDKENEKALRQIAAGGATNSYEAMQLLIVYFFLHEYVYKTRVRTLGRLDVLLQPFYENDLRTGRFTKAEIREMLKFFLNKFSSADVPYGLPICLGGVDENGTEVTSEISYLILETYRELSIYNPKIHIRVSEQTPADFVKLVLDCIRTGHSSFVFCNDGIAIRALTDVGIDEKDARDYVPVGCYEPAVWGKEIGCTGNGCVSMIKAIEYTFSGGIDATSGAMIGVPCAKLDTFEDFYQAAKAQIARMTKTCLDYRCLIERYYDEIGPDPLLSAMYEDCVERGVDALEGGAKYNNSSLYFYFIASFVDSLTAVKKLVYDERRLTLAELHEILKRNWEGAEKLRLLVQRMPEKYGNENETADFLTKDIADYCASLVNNVPNGRGGVFKAALFTIDHCFDFGEKTPATPDGRKDGEPLSKNLCASWTMDKNGILALIHSVTKIDHAKFPNGSVLDVVLHPSAVKGEEGLNAFYGILKTYLAKGGFAMHGNVFDADDLRDAQAHPEQYPTMQVRVCGWNAYFVTLAEEVQNEFIRQAEGAR